MKKKKQNKKIAYAVVPKVVLENVKFKNVLLNRVDHKKMIPCAQCALVMTIVDSKFAVCHYANCPNYNLVQMREHPYRKLAD